MYDPDTTDIPVKEKPKVYIDAYGLDYNAKAITATGMAGNPPGTVIVKLGVKHDHEVNFIIYKSEVTIGPFTV